MRAEPTDMATLKIPRALYQRLRQVIAGTGFRSVTEFATYVLRDLAAQPPAEAQDAGRAAGKRKKAAPRITGAELKAARERLRELGYL